MAQLLLLTNALAPSAEVLPALGLLTHQVRVLPAEAAVLVDAPPADAVIVDGRRDLAGARSLCRLLRTTGLSSPLLLVLTEGGMAAVTADWGTDDVLLDSAGPAEVEARLRLATGRTRLAEAAQEPETSEIRAGDVTVDEVTAAGRPAVASRAFTFRTSAAGRRVSGRAVAGVSRRSRIDHRSGARTAESGRGAGRRVCPARIGPTGRGPAAAALGRPGRRERRGPYYHGRLDTTGDRGPCPRIDGGSFRLA